MAIREHFDLYPASNPRDGARLVRLTYTGSSGALQEAEYRAEANAPGAGRFLIRATEPEAAFIDQDGFQYVRVVQEDTDALTETVVGGFFLDSGDFGALTTNSTKPLTFAGAGTLAYLDNAQMWSHTYLNISGFADQDPFDDIWRLYAAGTGNELGAILWRVITEAQGYRPGTSTYTHKHGDGTIHTDNHLDDRIANPFPFLTMGFDRFVDSSGNPWTIESGDFTARVGESVLSVVRRLIEAGLYVSLDPDTFVLNAWEQANHGRVRTGSAWGSTVVRFQAPSAGTVASSNIKSDARRAVAPRVRRSALLTGGNDVYAVATASVTMPREGFYPSDVAQPAALQAVANAQIAARTEAGDTARLRGKLANLPLQGAYAPLVSHGVLLDDQVTLHSGTEPWDWNQAVLPVAAIELKLRPGGDWDVWYELGSAYTTMRERTFQGQPSAGPHTHAPNPELCRIPVAGSSETLTAVFSWDWEEGNAEDLPAYPSIAQPARVDAVKFREVIAGGANGTSWSVDVAPGGSVGPNNIPGEGQYAIPVEAGAIYRLGFWIRAGNTTFTVRWHDGSFPFEARSPIATEDYSYSGNHVTWVQETLDVVAPAGATAISFFLTDAGIDEFGMSKVGIGFAGDPGDGHADLVGTSIRASRCDHRHDVHRDTAPTVNDDANDGYKVGTIWAQLDSLATPTAIVGVWMLLDASAGAAVWAPWPGGGDEIEIENLGTAETDTALVLHPDGSGGVAWGTDATGGGGGGGSSPYPLDTPPGSVHAKDDEFSGGSLDVKWTNPATSTRTLTLAVANGWVTFEPSDSGSASTGARGGWGIRQTAPSGSFTVTAHIADGPGGTVGTGDDARSGIFVARTADSKGHVLGHQLSQARYANANGFTYSESADWGAFDGYDVHSTNTNWFGSAAGLWYKIVWASGAGSLSFYYSTDGVHWAFLATRTGQSQPDRVGLAIWGNAADIRADHKLSADWFRVTEP